MTAQLAPCCSAVTLSTHPVGLKTQVSFSHTRGRPHARNHLSKGEQNMPFVNPTHLRARGDKVLRKPLLRSLHKWSTAGGPGPGVTKPTQQSPRASSRKAPGAAGRSGQREGRLTATTPAQGTARHRVGTTPVHT